MSQKILLFSNRCIPCGEVKKLLQKEITSGNIKVVDIDKDTESQEIAQLFGGVPTLLEENNGELSEIKLFYDKKRR